jgi:hypothetical protein
MELQLTDNEKKLLNKFFIYIRSFGTDSASIDYSYEYEDITWNSGLHGDGHRKIELFPGIDDIIRRILEQVDSDDFESNFHDNDVDYYTIEIEFLAKEKEIRVSCSYTTMGYEEVSSEDEITNLAPFETYIEQGVSEIICTYTGGGDSGYIEGSMDVNGESENTSADIKDSCYNALTHFGGWEINEGSQGNIVFNLDNNTVTINHVWNTEERNGFDLLNVKV